MWWTLITGTGYLKCYWDQSVVDEQSGDVGDIIISPVTPFHVFVPDLREVELENQLYVINAYTRPVELVKRQYAAELAETEIKASVVAANEVMDDAYLNLKAGGAQPDSVLVQEMWMKPGAHPDFPKGGLITVVDTHVVAMVTDGIPYATGEYPFIKFDHIPTGKFYAESVIVDLISLQREYNRTRSQIVEAKNRMAKPQLMAPKGSVDPSKITTEPGIVIEYRPGLDPPRPMPLQPLPAYVIQELERCIGDMEDISSQHATSKGAAPTGVTAATAISYLQERDDSLLTHTYDSVEQGMEKLARQYLGHVVQYWDYPRTVKVVGDDGAFDTMVLKGSDIKNGTDIRMQAGTSLPQSKAAKQALIMDMMTRQFITPDQGLRIMEIGGVQKLYEQLQVDERASQRENLKMKTMDPNLILGWENQKNQADALAAQQAGAVGVPQGLLPPEADPALASLLGPNSQAPDPNAPQMDPTTPQPNPIGNLGSPGAVDPQTGMPAPSAQMPLLVPTNTWDNHAVHIEIHNRFRKGQTFDKLGPEIKTLFESHIKQHQDALNASSMAMAGGSMGPSGPPPGGPPAPDSGGGGSNQFTGLPPQGAQNG